MRVVVLLLISLSWVTAAVRLPEGTARVITAADFFQHPQKNQKYNELWSYQFVFDNGTKAFVNYSWMYLPQQGNRIGCDLSFWNFKGKSYSVGRQYPTARFQEDKSGTRISIKEEYFMEKQPGKGHRVLFTADKGGEFFLDLEFTSAVPGIVPGNGEFQVDGHRYGLFVHIPYGRVQGRIAYGKDTIEVKGYGYMDQSWQTDQATELAQRSMAFSTASAKEAFAGRLGITSKGETFGYAVYTKDGKSQVVTAKTILEGESAYRPGKDFPKQVTVQWNQSDVPDLKFDASKRQQKFSMLSNFDGWIEKKAVRFMMGGELLFIRGRSQSSLGNALDWMFTGF